MNANPIGKDLIRLSGWDHIRIVLRAFAGVAGSLLIAGCNLMVFPEPPTPIPLPTSAPETQQASEVTPTASPTHAASQTQTASPSPATLPPHARLPSLPPAAELEIRWISMIDAQNGWALGAGPDDIQRALLTADGGRSWRDVSPPALEQLTTVKARLVGAFNGMDVGWVLRYVPAEPTTGPEEQIAVVWRTENGGQSWTASHPLDLPFVGGLGSPPYLRFGEPGRVWLMARAGGAGMHRYPVALLRSADEGMTWRMLEDPFEGTGLQSCYKSGFAVQGSDYGLVTLESCPVEGAEVRFSRDGGMTWVSELLPPPAGEPSLFENAGCESRSPNMLSATEWVLAVVCRPFEGDPEPRWYLYRTEDGGETWQAQSYPGGDLFFLDERTIWALTRDLHLSRDGGETWELIKRVTWEGQFSFVSSEEGWAVARDGGEIALVRTTDGGRTWQIIEPESAP